MLKNSSTNAAQISLTRGAPAVTQYCRQQGCPRQQPQGQYRQKKPCRLVAIELRAVQVALEVLKDEKEMRKLRIAYRYQHEPGRCQQRQRHQRPPWLCAQRQLPVAINQHEQHADRTWNQNADQALGQHRERHPHAQQQRQVPRRCRPRARRLYQQRQRGHRDLQAEAQPHVERGDARHGDVQQRARLHHDRQQRGALIVQPASQREGQHQAKQAAHCRPQAHRPGVLAEQLECGGRGPVSERRLLEIFDRVEPRRDPIAAGDHLARDLGVAAFVGIEQVRTPERQKPQQCQAKPENGYNGTTVFSNKHPGPKSIQGEAAGTRACHSERLRRGPNERRVTSRQSAPGADRSPETLSCTSTHAGSECVSASTSIYATGHGSRPDQALDPQCQYQRQASWRAVIAAREQFPDGPRRAGGREHQQRIDQDPVCGQRGLTAHWQPSATAAGQVKPGFGPGARQQAQRRK
jgi:hypothetical protein